MKMLRLLTKSQKEAIGLLQIGTFLEYFVLMLYVHMAVLLNELFFPKADPHTAALLAALSFVLAPIGFLLFCYLGDRVGRKATVIISMMLMAISSLMITLPTFAQIGIAAAWVITICRAVHGAASSGVMIGAEVYLTETLKKPECYPIVSFIAVASCAGTIGALVVASAITSLGMNWRIAFWVGSGIAAILAVISLVACKKLNETPEFTEMKRRLREVDAIEDKQEASKAKKSIRNMILPETQGNHRKSAFWFFLLQCSWPICFYFSYVHCGNLLKSLGCSAEQIIHQNLAVTIVQLVSLTFVSYLSYLTHPLKILKVKLLLFFGFILLMPFLLLHAHSPVYIFLIQAVSVSLAIDSAPGVPVFLAHLPVLKRYTYASFTYAISRAAMYVVTSFGLIYLTNWFGTWGLWCVFLPSILGFYIGLRHFEKLEFATAHLGSRDTLQSMAQ